MLYLYDKAICDELERSFDPDSMGTGSVKVVDPDNAIDVIAQIQDDSFKLPAVILTRNQEIILDENRMNFTQIHKGTAAVIDDDTNKIYYERAMPIKLGYNMTVLTANQADMDELTRELLFKFSDTFFFNIDSPYESGRNMRFGVTIEPGSSIESASRSLEYLTGGKIYQSIVHLRCEGCILLHYREAKLRRWEYGDVEAEYPGRHVDLSEYRARLNMFRR